MSKGSKQRPASVDADTYGSNYERIFAPRPGRYVRMLVDEKGRLREVTPEEAAQQEPPA